MKTNPRKLYETINEQSKLIDLKELLEANDMLDVEYDGEFTDQDLDRLTELIYETPSLNILRGDVITINKEDGYRNDGKALWTGLKLVNLDGDIDDYGNVTAEFAFPEFPINHFYESIDHNFITYLSKQAVQEAIKTFDEQTQRAKISNNYDTYEIKPQVIMEDENKYNLNTRKLTKAEFEVYIRKNPQLDDNEEYDEYNVYTLVGSIDTDNDDE